MFAVSVTRYRPTGAAPSRKSGLRPPWKPGQSGNPSGYSGLYGETVRLAREASPTAIRRMIELTQSADERVATVAINSILDRAWGKPREAKPEEEQARPIIDTSRLTEEQRQALLAVFRSATKAQGQ